MSRDECEHGSLRRSCVVCELTAEKATLRDEIGRLKTALLEVSTDMAQDALEDPVGYYARQDAGWRRLSLRTAQNVSAALAGKGGG